MGAVRLRPSGLPRRLGVVAELRVSECKALPALSPTS